MALTLSPEDIQAITESLKPAIIETANQAAAAHVTKRNESFEKKMDSKLEQFIPKPIPQEEEQEKITAKEDIRRLREELKTERESGARKEMRRALEESLQSAGIPSVQVKAVAAKMIHDDKSVDIDKAGQAVFKFNGQYGEEVLSLQEGVSNWVKGEGKAFIPAPVAKGAGQRPVRTAAQSFIEPGASQSEIDSAWLSKIRNRT